MLFVNLSALLLIILARAIYRHFLQDNLKTNRLSSTISGIYKVLVLSSYPVPVKSNFAVINDILILRHRHGAAVSVRDLGDHGHDKHSQWLD